MNKLNIFIENTYKDFNIDEVKVYKNTIKMAEYILCQQDIIEKSCLGSKKYKTVTFDIVLTNDEEIHYINKEYRNKNKPTDVITFAIFADSNSDEQFIIDDDINLGEIIISLDTINTNANENNIAFDNELYFVIAHGILHLLGFDHMDIEGYNYMVNIQNKAKALLNV